MRRVRAGRRRRRSRCLARANGLTSYYKALALRLAEVGIAAVAIDYYGRTAGLRPRDESFDFRPHLLQLTSRGLFADSQAALEYLRTSVGSPLATFPLGFCMGGALAFLNGATDAALAGAIGLYAFTGQMD
jgi:carboxymethylenebutenolidase